MCSPAPGKVEHGQVPGCLTGSGKKHLEAGRGAGGMQSCQQRFSSYFYWADWFPSCQLWGLPVALPTASSVTF